MINHTSSSDITPLCKIDEIRCWENRPFTRIWPDPEVKTSRGVTRPIRKKHRKTRTTFTMQQLQLLENNYIRNKYIDSEVRKELAKCLNIDEKCIKIWFQNRRMKEKRESSEACSDSSNDILNAGDSQHATQYELNRHPQNPQYIPPDHCTFGINQNYMLNYNSHSMQTVPDNGNTFYYDGNIYPTQYFPNNSAESIATHQYYNIQGNVIQNYWAESCTDIGYI